MIAKLLKAMKTVDGLLNRLDLVSGHIPGDVFALHPSLMVVIRSIRALAHDAKLAAFHLGNLSHLLQKRLKRISMLHKDKI